ncbi:endo alpha-1,4 polygalactosaminidase [Streptomyces sp. NPDC090025]|uniref:endo alpha-1,4 polygalactosaminidase n=1 Tax=Streptomyces sp. NPDC090025 TaxID=3365922 RepID=UPI003833834A
MRHRSASAPGLVAAAAALCLLATACAAGGGRPDDPSGAPSGAPSAAPAVTPPPTGVRFDYQLRAPYPPPPGVQVVARDHSAPPAPGVYNICYVNAFQAQPGAERDWDADLLLRDGAGKVVMDADWGEAVLDTRTADKRTRIARKVNRWIDDCAAKGYRAVDPDNYDSYTRVPAGLLTADGAKALLALLAEHAHAKGLAIGQKNTPQLAGDRRRVGADFAVVEECGQYEECAAYVAAFGDRVIVVEYTAQGMRRACAGWGGRLSVVRRDLQLVPKGEPGYHYEVCPE